MTNSYTRGLEAHPSYGTLAVNGGWMPVIEGIGFFGGQALGPIMRSNGYPSPSTLPSGAPGDVPTWGTAGAGGGLTWPLAIGLLVVAGLGIYLVHRATWR